MRLFVVCSTALSIMLAGCTSLPTPPASPLTLRTELPIPAVEPIEMPTPLQQLPDSLNPEGSGVTGEAPVELLAEIQADAAGRTGLETEEIVVIQDQAVVWPDGSLGCPKPGMMYTQALVDGYHILVQAGDTVLDYRATSRGSFVLCESPLRAAPAQTPSQ